MPGVVGGSALGERAGGAAEAGGSLRGTSQRKGRGSPAHEHMNFKRIFRGPLVYVILGAVILIIGLNLLTASGFRAITTQQGLDLLGGDTVEAVKIVGREQRVDLALSEPYVVEGVELGTQVQFYYVAPRGDAVIEAITASKAEFDDEVDRKSTRLNSSHVKISYAVFCLKKKKKKKKERYRKDIE